MWKLTDRVGRKAEFLQRTNHTELYHVCTTNSGILSGNLKNLDFQQLLLLLFLRARYPVARQRTVDVTLCHTHSGKRPAWDAKNEHLCESVP